MSSKPKTTTTQEDATPTLVPKLRFPEFRDAGTWGGRIVSQLAKVTTGAKDTQNKVEGGRYPFYVRSQTVENIDSYSYEGEAVLTSGDGVGVGKNFHYIKGKFDFHQRVYCIYDFDEGVSGLFFYLYFSEHFGKRVMRMSAKNSVDSVRMAMITEMPVTMPSLSEQQKIAECLSSVDELIAAQARKLDAIKTHKKGLMQQLFPREGETQPRLRFPEFKKAGEWVESTVDEIIATVTPPKKLQTADYQPEGEFPIIDQSQNAICGWTNDRDALTSEGLPVIVFGDHTCALKFIDYPFVQGADGIKIFRPKRGIDVRFLFCALEANPVVQETYKRHFSMLKEKKLSFPDPKTGEQQRIATCLTSLDDLIAAQTQKLEALKTHKKGLMQQLFPSPEEVEA